MARIGVDISGDARSLLRAFKQSELAAAEFNARMNTLGQTTRGAFAGAGFNKGALLFGSSAFVGAAVGTEIIKNTVSAASDLNEQLTKSQQVFGDSSSEIKTWAQGTAKSFGLSQRTALEAMGTFGNLFRTVDLLPEQSAKMSKALTELGADLASFNNANIEDALLAIRSGLIGEAEPLRKFGVLLSETRVQAKALADTGKQNVKSLTDQEKALARYEIILEDTIPAQGDFARTSSGLANQQRVLSAEVEDLSANLGKVFIPVIQLTVISLNEFIGSINDTISAGGRLREFFHHDDTFDGFNKGIEDAGDHAAGFFKRIRDGIPGMEHFLDLRNRFAGLGDEPVTPDVGTARAGGDRFEAQAAAATGSLNAIAAAARNAAAAAKDSDKAFSAFAKGIGLKLDKARLSDSIQAQIAVLREFEAAILRQEKKVGKTFDLEDALTRTRLQIKALQDQELSDSLRSQREKLEAVLDEFDLKLSKASLTKGLGDDIKVLQSELAVVRNLIATTKDNADLKAKEIDLEKQILDLKKQQTEETKAQFDLARSRAESLFGTLFSAQEEAQRTLTILGGSKGKQTVVLPGAGGGEDARGLLGDLTAQIKSFKTLQVSILELQRKGAPKSLLEAARSGEISADQVNALAKANSATLNQIFKNVRLADKLVSRAAKAEIHAKDVSLRANTVTVRGAIAASGGGGARESGFVVNGGIHLHGVQNVKQLENELERRRKKRTQQTRGRSGGKR